MAAPMQNDSDSSDSGNYPEYLDPRSPQFDPRRALYERQTPILSPDARQFNNLAEFENFLKGKDAKSQKKENEARMKKKEQQMPGIIAVRAGAQAKESVRKAALLAKTAGPSKRSKTQERRLRITNVFTRMEGYKEGPLSLLRHCVEERLRVIVVVRAAVAVRSRCRGYVVAFDKHFNIALMDVDEKFIRPIPQKKRDKSKDAETKSTLKRTGKPEDSPANTSHYTKEIKDREPLHSGHSKTSSGDLRECLKLAKDGSRDKPRSDTGRMSASDYFDKYSTDRRTHGDRKDADKERNDHRERHGTDSGSGSSYKQSRSTERSHSRSDFRDLSGRRSGSSERSHSRSEFRDSSGSRSRSNDRNKSKTELRDSSGSRSRSNSKHDKTRNSESDSDKRSKSRYNNRHSPKSSAERHKAETVAYKRCKDYKEYYRNYMSDSNVYGERQKKMLERTVKSDTECSEKSQVKDKNETDTISKEEKQKFQPFWPLYKKWTEARCYAEYEIITRHINQLFIRGDNVVSISIADG